MKRLFTRILLCLLAGAIINIAMAWGFWMRGQRPPNMITGDSVWTTEEVDQYNINIWRRHATVEWPREPEFALSYEPTGLTFHQLLSLIGQFSADGLTQAEYTALAQLRRTFSVDRVDCGWPLRSLTIDRWMYRKGFTVVQSGSDGWRLDTNPVYELPVRPLVAGFLINSVVFGSSILVIGIGLRCTMAGMRRRRGRCPECNFDLRGDLPAGCPECGWRREPGSAEPASKPAALRGQQ